MINRFVTVILTEQRCLRVVCAGVLLATGMLYGANASATEPSEPRWTPQPSERLVKLPESYLKKSLEQDYANSTLGNAQQKLEEKIKLKASTLTDLQSAVGVAEGDVRMELRHQFLAEKRSFVELMAQKIDIHRRYAKTRLNLYKDMLNKIAREKGKSTPALQELAEMQKTARHRYESSVEAVDINVFQTAGASESKYAAKYAKNVRAIEKLLGSITEHRMSDVASIDGKPITKEVYLRKQMADAESDLALIDQENSILGYMAKLVALDAMALSEEALDAELADSDMPGSSTDPADMFDFFISK